MNTSCNAVGWDFPTSGYSFEYMSNYFFGSCKAGTVANTANYVKNRMSGSARRSCWYDSSVFISGQNYSSTESWIAVTANVVDNVYVTPTTVCP